MADFNVDVGGVPGGPSPVQPVQDYSTAEGLNALGNLFVSTGNAAKSAIVAGQAQEANANAVHVLGSIKQNLLLKADLVDQGWSSDRARRATRRQLAADLANHPNLSKQITELYSTTLADKGLASNILEGTQEEKDKRELRMAAVKDAQTMGLWPPDLDPNSEQADNILNTLQQYRLHATQLEATQKELATKRAQIGLQSDVVQLASAKQSYVTGGITQQTARLNLHEKQAEVQSRAALTGGAKAYQDLMTTKLADTYNKFKTGQLTAQEAILQMDQDSAKVMNIVNKDSPNAGGEYIRNVLSPMTTIVSGFKDAVSGKLDADSLQNQLNAETTRMSLMQIHNNPEVLPIIAMSQQMRNVPPAILYKMTSDAFKMVGFNVDTGEYSGVSSSGAMSGINNKGMPNFGKPKLPNFTGSDQDVKSALSYTKAGIESILSGQYDNDGSIKEVNNTLKTAIKSAIKYGPSTDNATELNGLVDLFSSSSFGKYVKSGKFTADEADMSKVSEMLHQHYDKEIIPLITKEFVSAKVFTGQRPNATGNVMVPDIDSATNKIEATFDGSGIKFTVIDPSSDTSGLSGQADRMTKTVAPVFNKTIKAYSNLKGTSLKSEYDILLNGVLPQENSNESE